jgi:hypothetical protein
MFCRPRNWKKKLAACFHKPPGNYHFIEERMPYGNALMGGGMKCLCDFIMMVKPVSMIMTKSLLRESPVICMGNSKAGCIPLSSRVPNWRDGEIPNLPKRASVHFREILSGFGTDFRRNSNYCG